LAPLPRTDGSQTVSRFEDCRRKCEPCGIGYSNGRTNPTSIYQNPLQNLPSEVQHGLHETLSRSLNITARKQKLIRIGFSTSEDAATWTLFSWLAREAPDTLSAVAGRWLGKDVPNTPTLLLWGAPVSASDRGEAVRKRLIEISDSLGENPDRRSEPDVVLDCDNAGVIFVEVKLGSPNSVSIIADRHKFDRYLEKTEAFTDPESVKRTGLYELARNWRFGWELAAGRQLRLVNLYSGRVSEPSERLDQFAKSLSAANAAFKRDTWTDVLGVCVEATPPPPWLTGWLSDRDVYDLPAASLVAKS
jgi:hypothetical protein